MLKGPSLCLLALAIGASLAAPALAQSDKKGDSSGDDDVVFDNRDLSKKKAEERKQQQEADPQFASDDPFADTAPDPAGLRRQRWKPGFGGAYRLGFALPMGKTQEGAKDMSEGLTGLIFLWGDIGYWPIPYLFGGLYVTGGYVVPDCEGNVSCSAWDVRGGPEVLVRVLPFENMTPFLGVGAGYEWFKLKASLPTGESSSATLTGWELLNAQAGLEVRSRGSLYGLFVTYSIGKFSKVSTDSGSGDIEKQATHSWLGIGARGTIE